MKKSEGITIGDRLEHIWKIAQFAKENKMLTRGYITNPMGSLIAKDISVKEVNSIATAMNDMGVDEIVLQDTVCAGTTEKVLSLIKGIKIPREKLGVHFYDSRYMALEMILTALATGVSNITTSIGGIGRSPCYDTMLGNSVASDLVFVLDCMGIEHRINWRKLLKAERNVCDWLERENLSDVYKVDFEQEMARYKEKVQSILK